MKLNWPVTSKRVLSTFRMLMLLQLWSVWAVCFFSAFRLQAVNLFLFRRDDGEASRQLQQLLSLHQTRFRFQDSECDVVVHQASMSCLDFISICRDDEHLIVFLLAGASFIQTQRKWIFSLSRLNQQTNPPLWIWERLLLITLKVCLMEVKRTALIISLIMSAAGKTRFVLEGENLRNGERGTFLHENLRWFILFRIYWLQRYEDVPLMNTSEWSMCLIFRYTVLTHGQTGETLAWLTVDEGQRKVCLSSRVCRGSPRRVWRSRAQTKDDTKAWMDSHSFMVCVFYIHVWWGSIKMSCMMWN